MIPKHECPLPCCIDVYLRRKAGVTQPLDPAMYGKRLSPTELKVLALYAWTGSAPAVAKALGRSLWTIRNHMSHAQAKLGSTTWTNTVWLAWPQIRDAYDEIESGTARSLAADRAVGYHR